ncbi:MAG: hypothetical protein R3324_14530, partial [Halobacteriales archaeon]|nr:hypothetical protein [Halobacteriales archaeon]
TEAGFRWEGWVGLAVCAVCGGLYARAARKSMGDAIWHGGMVGGIAAFLGTAVAVSLADRPGTALLWGTLAGIGVGAAAGAAVHAFPGAGRPDPPEGSFQP